MNLFAKLNCVKYLSDTEHNIIDLINKDPVAFTQMTIVRSVHWHLFLKLPSIVFAKSWGIPG
jgi:hypothetical protein